MEPTDLNEWARAAVQALLRRIAVSLEAEAAERLQAAARVRRGRR